MNDILNQIPPSSVILLLEDDPAVLVTLAAFVTRTTSALSHLGTFKVLSAKTRNEALQALAYEGINPSMSSRKSLLSKPLVLAVVDQNLGDLDPDNWEGDQPHAEGLPFVQLLSEMSLTPQLVVLTGEAATVNTRGFEAKLYGADAYLDKKDFSGEFISNVVQLHLQRFFGLEYRTALLAQSRDGN